MTAAAPALRSIGAWGRMVKFSHSVFALPFALSGTALAAARHGISLRQVVWVVVAMVAARNAAMGWNRLADHAIDARNPRTAGRELPAGVLSRPAVLAFTLGLAALFVVASFQLGRLCGLLSPVALAVVFGYSYTKRFTWASHLVLGLSLSMAPMGGWLAVAGRFDLVPWCLAAAVFFWVAGFDTIYACQDEAFDRSAGLFSIPARFGAATALVLARVFHLLVLLAMAAVGAAAHLHPVYWAGIALIAAVLLWEHRLVRADDLSKVGVAFLNANGLVSMLYLGVVLTALAFGRMAS
ncbi:MAG TPA: UbiA-like polyprenyltransferase [Candidatus Polarisedimenticolaceae bacterium]|nr:UbiA-like polyprenyltransferase [Candidatus Polarisedimenticolaceae bacterium]